MTIKARSKLVEDIYTPKSEEKEKNPTTFKLKALTSFQYLDVLGDMDGDLFTAKALEKISEYSFVSANNLLDMDGKKIERLNADYLPPLLIIELANRVISISTISEEEKKI